MFELVGLRKSNPLRPSGIDASLLFHSDPLVMASLLLEYRHMHEENNYYLGCRDGAGVRALASHQCGPGSIPRLGVMCGLSLLVLYSALRGFQGPGTPVFPSPQKPKFDLIFVNLLISIYSVPD